MTDLLIKIFIKDHKNTKHASTRRAYGTLASVVGIVLNIILSLVKLAVGVACGSVSITADATNNLSDAGAQIVSLVSFKISAKPADRDHPFGHARIEYVASMIVSFLILHIGFDLLMESVNKIKDPEPVEFSAVSLVILSVSILCKLWLCVFNRRIAKKIDSSVMRATSADSLSDAVATAAVLISMLITRFTNFQTDAYMGVAVSVLILIAGVKILNDTKNSILGSAPEPEVVEGIVSLVKEYPEILGIHDMIVHNYGAGNTIASLHAEVDGSQDVFYTHDVIDTVEKRIYHELGVLATIHLDPIVTDDVRVCELRQQVENVVLEIDDRLTIHDFRFVDGVTHSNLIFDVAVPFELKMSEEELKREISNKISTINPNYFAVVTIDRQ